MTSLIRIPFADSGDKAVVPENDAGGGVNMTQGYGQAYSLDPATDPSAKRIERDLMNGLFYMITKAIQELQINGIAPYISSADNGGSAFAYGLGAVVLYNGIAYQSLKSSNTDLPTVATSWAQVMNKETTTGRLLSIQTFTASGTYTPTPGTKRVRVKIWGGGGSGRGIAAQGGATSGAGGGYVEGIYTLPAGSSFPIVVGKGGEAIPAGNGSDGKGGGDSSFAALNVSATGGGGGSTGNPKGGVGKSPAEGLIISVSGQGGQGGSGTNLGGVGGGAYASFGGLPHVGTAGDAGGYPGGGGAGASYDSTPQASGAGSAGMVIIEELS